MSRRGGARVPPAVHPPTTRERPEPDARDDLRWPTRTCGGSRQLRQGQRHTKQWSDAEPNDPLGPDRTAKPRSCRTTSAPRPTSSRRAAGRASGAQLANDQLKQGAALELAGDWTEHVTSCRKPTTPRRRSFGRRATWPSTKAHQPVADRARFVTNARVQLGDTELRAKKNYAAAEEHYKPRGEREALLRRPPDQLPVEATLRREQLYRPEVREQRSVGARRARPRRRTRSKSRRRRWPSIRTTRLPREPRLRTGEGRRSRRCGRQLPRHPRIRIRRLPRGNDLGVILAKQGRFADAVDAFRQALAANGDYAIAQFNLGLALDQQGASHALESQGQIAAATRSDRRCATKTARSSSTTTRSSPRSTCRSRCRRHGTSREHEAHTRHRRRVVLALCSSASSRPWPSSALRQGDREDAHDVEKRTVVAVRALGIEGPRRDRRRGDGRRLRLSTHPVRGYHDHRLSTARARHRGRDARVHAPAEPGSPVASRCRRVTTRGCRRSRSAVSPHWSAWATRRCLRPTTKTASYRAQAALVRSALLGAVTLLLLVIARIGRAVRKRPRCSEPRDESSALTPVEPTTERSSKKGMRG